MRIVFFFLLFFSQSTLARFTRLNHVPTKPCLRMNDYGEPCLDERESSQILNEVITEFFPYFQKVAWNLSGKLEWSNLEENATYNFGNANKVILIVFGGAARATEMSREALVTVACHELGHIYGFITKTGNPKTYGMEGEADYFATNICLPLIISRMKTVSNIKIPLTVTNTCRQSSYLKAEICIRTNQAALAASRFRSRILSQKEPSFLSADPTQVGQTNPNLTSVQCGLDTFFAGSLNIQRPRCWYKPE